MPAARAPGVPPPVAQPAGGGPPNARAAAAGRGRARVAWRQCANHPQVASANVCTQCQRGWCPECARQQGTAVICPSCDALCRSVTEQEQAEARERRRARPLRADLGQVFGYPFVDPLGYVILSIVVGVFSLMSAIAMGTGGVFGVLITQGLVYAYAFSAINRVSAGKMNTFMPEISDLTDLIGPVRHGLAAMLVSSGPLLLLLFLVPAAAFWSSRGPHRTPTAAVETSPTAGLAGVDLGGGGQGAQRPGPADSAGASEWDEGERSASVGSALGVLALLGLTLLWKIAYSPVALIAAAISRSFVATLNPVVGVAAIRRMGSVYWEAMVAYTALSVAETLLGGIFGMIPIAGHFLRALVQCYAYLSIGCLLGLAVFKKAPELGLD
jgi:hypothetical protein